MILVKEHVSAVSCYQLQKSGIIAKFYRVDFVIYSHSRDGKTLSYSQINMVMPVR